MLLSFLLLLSCVETENKYDVDFDGTVRHVIGTLSQAEF